MRWRILTIALLVTAIQSCNQSSAETTDDSTEVTFTIKKQGDQLLIYRHDQQAPVVTQEANPTHRPYLHPILAPGTEVSLTQFSPDHHKHQTGLYWGFTRVNGTGAHPDTLKKWFYRKDKPADIQAQIGRDFFHHPEGNYWKRVGATILIAEGPQVKWQTTYQMLDADGQPLMEETQTWTMAHRDDKHFLSLEWTGKAKQDITINEFDYGGLFLRMPWKDGVAGEAVNAARQRNQMAEGQRAMWVDVGMEIEGLQEWGHVAIFDHPDNDGFPQKWRVDHQLGVGPVRAREGDWDNCCRPIHDLSTPIGSL